MKLLNALYLLVAFVVLFLIGVFIYLWRYSLGESPYVEPVKKEELKLAYQAKQGEDWIDSFANFKESPKDILPTNLMYIEINKNALQGFKTNKKFELLLDRCDFYSIFCLNNLSKKLGIDLTIVKKGKENSIVFSTNNPDSIDDFVLKLKRFNIHSQIKEIK